MLRGACQIRSREDPGTRVWVLRCCSREWIRLFSPGGFGQLARRPGFEYCPNNGKYLKLTYQLTGERDALIRSISLLKRNAVAAPFEQAFEEHHALHEEASKFTSEEAPQGVREGGEVKAIHYREEEAIYIKASHDRVTVIFSTVFREETDRVFGKVFIQEFVDARRRAIQNAPQVLYRTDPPLELQGVPGVKDSGTGEIGYVTFGMRIIVLLMLLS